MKEKSHISYYIFLIGILIAGLLLILAASGDRQTQMLIILGLGFSYVVIGISHHLINHDLVAKIVIEYVLIAALGVAAAFFIFKGGFGF